MEGQLAVTVRINDRSIKLSASPEEEEYIREAAVLINERLDYYRKRGVKDTQEALSQVAIDCAVARLKGDSQIDTFQKIVFKNVEHLKSIMGPLANPNT